MSTTPHNIYTVTSIADTSDPNSLTLRDALAAATADVSANASPNDGGYFDEVTFAPSLSGQTITLTAGTLNVASGVIVDGTAGGASSITISGNNSYTVFTVPGTPTGNANAAATINNVTIENGYAKGAGGTSGVSSSSPDGGPGGDAAGGIFVQGGHLSVSNDTFNNNTAAGGIGGFGFSSKGTGGTSSKGAGGSGGNAAGAVYVEPGAVVDYASGLVATNDSASGGFAGYGDPSGSGGAAYPISNDQTIDANTTITCFASGTLIWTASGDVAVENLAVGDMVVTASGACRPIRWLGHRAIDCRNHPSPHEAHPIRVSADAFGANRPTRELFLSPGHPVLVGADEDGAGGHLVPIMCLINGTTIERVAVDAVVYWHVELDQHDTLLAEGLPAESYIDLGSRPWFAGVDGALYDPDMALPGMPGRCRPVAVDGPIVEAERRRLDMVFATRLSGASAWPDEASLAFG